MSNIYTCALAFGLNILLYFVFGLYMKDSEPARSFSYNQAYIPVGKLIKHHKANNESGHKNYKAKAKELVARIPDLKDEVEIIFSQIFFAEKACRNYALNLNLSHPFKIIFHNADSVESKKVLYSKYLNQKSAIDSSLSGFETVTFFTRPPPEI